MKLIERLREYCRLKKANLIALLSEKSTDEIPRPSPQRVEKERKEGLYFL